MADEPFMKYAGHCPVCDCAATYVSKYSWLRGHLGCAGCPVGSLPRERALALVLNERYPNWRELSIHECSPAKRGISKVVRAEAPAYIGSHYFPSAPFGSMVGEWRNEDLENQTFPDDFFDIVMTLDVMEHLFHPEAALKEIYRTLRPGGAYISTFPIKKDQVVAEKMRAELLADGEIVHHAPEEYHGNPVDSKGALVTFDYGYDIHGLLAQWAPFDVSITRAANRTAGVLGEFTEVIVCTKPMLRA